MTKQIKNDFDRLRAEKMDFMNKLSLSRIQISRRVGSKFSKEILNNIKPVERYGTKRYLLTDISKYLNKNKGGKDIFFELVGGQSSFIPPTGKHHQTKLFIKK